ncbi:transducin beta-like protein 3 [Melanerpes formicivorus]|uniref:transducin beta-like protein 3 n=1 Tax=Melanerpes formicivorus TaxID=211600 RepID=UPI00358E77C4
MEAAAASPVRFKSNYAVSRRIEPFYKGGRVQLSRDGKFMFCPCGTKLNIIDVETGALRSLQQDEEEDITSFVLSPDDEMLVTGSRALLLRQWSWREERCVRSWRAVHTAPVASMAFDSTSTLLATGGCDSTIKVWDMIKQYCTHNLRGSSGVVHLVEFHPDPSCLQLFSSSIDYKIRIWDLASSKCVAMLGGHFSAVTSLAFADGNTLLSSGRDKVCLVWDLQSRESKGTVPVYESVEAAVLLPKEGDFSQLGVKKQGLHFVTAGSKGVLKVWEAATAACVYSQAVPFEPQEEASEHSLTQCLLLPGRKELVTVSVEHNIVLYDAQTLQLKKQLAGYNDEVLDVKFLGPGDSHIVVATNSPQLKVFELATSHCQILYGHTETVLALDVFRKGLMFVSCAKDRSLRLWRLRRDGSVACVAQGLGHAHSLGAVCCSRLKESFVVTSSQDCTIKIWDIPESLTSRAKAAVVCSPETLRARVTQRGHSKDVNSLAVSPNDRLLATGSQDRLAKLWAAADGSLLGVFAGHRRGIWCVQFSPVDQVLATSSADGSLKLWSLRDFSCLKTFEGHDASVLKVIFVSRGTQLLSGGSDGLLKLWTIKTNECVKTLDGHEDKIWGLHSNQQDDMVVTASSDSCIILWKDVTEMEQQEEQAKQEEQILKEQELSNLLQEKSFLRALGLALALARPHTVLTVLKAILKEPDGKKQLEENIAQLRRDQKEAVLSFLVTWNTNSRNCHEAQAVLETLLRHEAPDSLLQYSGIKSAVESLLPYTERHFQRLSRLLQASTFIDFLWQNMKLAEVSQQEEMTL